MTQQSRRTYQNKVEDRVIGYRTQFTMPSSQSPQLVNPFRLSVETLRTTFMAMLHSQLKLATCQSAIDLKFNTRKMKTF